jgi:diacylglycerol kinase (ATP)
MPKKTVSHRSLRVKLIFNTISGRPEESPQQLSDILNEMQNRDILPEVFLVRPESRVEAVVRRAIKEGFRMIVVAGGDGTIDNVAGAMVGSSTILGIIPTGTRNNVAFNLGIPSSIADAVALLRQGRQVKVDVGFIRSGRANRWFLEAATLGLLSDLYPAADNLQHGDLAQIGNLLSTFVSSTPSVLRVLFEGRARFDTSAYSALIANMPFLGPHFQIAPDVFCNDGLLDIFVFSEMSKLDLIAYVMQSTAGIVEDERVKHYRVKQLKIDSNPKKLVLADGVLLHQGPLSVLVHPRALTVVAGSANVAIRGRLSPSQADRQEMVLHE